MFPYTSVRASPGGRVLLRRLYRSDAPRDYDTYTVGVLHFNDAGHAVLAQHLKDFIDSLS